MRDINLSDENLAVQWQYVKRNLKDIGIITQNSLEQDIRHIIQNILQRSIDKEFEQKLGAELYERTDTREDVRCGYYDRIFTTTFGQASLKIPRARHIKVNYQLFDIYQRRHQRLDYAIALSCILGLSTRKQAKLFYEVIGDCVSHTTAAGLIYSLKEELNSYRQGHISNNYKYLIIDGMWVHIKELNIHNRPVLFALGITKDNKKELLSFKLAKGETEQEYTSFLNDLYRRGLTALGCIVADGAEGITAAANTVYPYAQRQYCYTHKLRNLSQNIRYKYKHRAKMLRQAKTIYKQPSKQKAIDKFISFVQAWQNIEPKACNNFSKNFIDTLHFYDYPEADRHLISTTNHLERQLEELRRRTMIQGYFKNEKSLNIWIFGIIKYLNITIPEDIQIQTIQPELQYESAQLS
jgi:transposase-like protein